MMHYTPANFEGYGHKAGKPDRRMIMLNAWNMVRRYGWELEDALRMEWRKYRECLPVHEVWGESLYNGKAELIASGLTYEQAEQRKWMNQYRFDQVTIKRAA